MVKTKNEGIKKVQMLKEGVCPWVSSVSVHYIYIWIYVCAQCVCESTRSHLFTPHCMRPGVGSHSGDLQHTGEGLGQWK